MQSPTQKESVKQSILDGKYHILRGLGKGFNSKVKLAYEQIGDKREYYAIKLLQGVLPQYIKNEIETLQRMKHDNIIELKEFILTAEYLKKNGTKRIVTAIVLELAPCGELFEFLFRTGAFSEPLARYYFHQLIDSLEHIHAQGYAHRDLKPENLLFSSNYALKLADFGFSTLLAGRDGSGYLYSDLGTRGYMAPEILMKTKYSGISVDLFAAGVILFTMVAGSPPFTDAHPKDPFYKLFVTNQHDLFWRTHQKYKSKDFAFSSDFVDLLNFMLAFDPALRLNISEIKEHPWYKAHTPTKSEVEAEMMKRYEKVVDEGIKEREERKRQAEMARSLERQRAKNAMDTTASTEFSTTFHSNVPITRDFSNAIIGASVKESSTKAPADYMRYEIDPRRDSDYMCDCAVEESVQRMSRLAKIKCTESSITNGKLTAKFYDDDDGNCVRFTCKFLKVDANTTCLRFDRLEGSSLLYYKIRAELCKAMSA